MLKQLLVFACAITVGAATGDVITTVDLLDSSDGGSQPPAGVIAVDVFVDASPGDVWTVGGLRGTVTPLGQSLGVALRYAGNDDPNSPHDERLHNPGTANRFSTFFTKPRNRDADGRYTNAAAAVAGQYRPTAPIETTTATEINVVWYASPPETSESPGVDGYIARVSLDVAGVIALPDFEGFGVGNRSAATGPIIFRCDTPLGRPEYGTVSASFRNPNLSGLDWAVWYVPEPASVGLLTLGGLLAIRRRG